MDIPNIEKPNPLQVEAYKTKLAVDKFLNPEKVDEVEKDTEKSELKSNTIDTKKPETTKGVSKAKK